MTRLYYFISRFLFFMSLFRDYWRYFYYLIYVKFYFCATINISNVSRFVVSHLAFLYRNNYYVPFDVIPFNVVYSKLSYSSICMFINYTLHYLWRVYYNLGRFEALFACTISSSTISTIPPCLQVVPLKCTYSKAGFLSE